MQTTLFNNSVNINQVRPKITGNKVEIETMAMVSLSGETPIEMPVTIVIVKKSDYLFYKLKSGMRQKVQSVHCAPRNRNVFMASGGYYFHSWMYESIEYDGKRYWWNAGAGDKIVSVQNANLVNEYLNVKEVVKQIR